MDVVRRHYVWARGKAGRALKFDFIRFGVVGVTGFIVTSSFFSLFHYVFGINVTVATMLGTEIGLISNFIFHERWTYNKIDHSKTPLWKKLVHFHMSSWSALVIVTAVVSIGVHVFGLLPLVSMVIAAAITMFWNFFWTKYYIFRNRDAAKPFSSGRAVKAPAPDPKAP